MRYIDSVTFVTKLQEHFYVIEKSDTGKSDRIGVKSYSDYAVKTPRGHIKFNVKKFLKDNNYELTLNQDRSLSEVLQGNVFFTMFSSSTLQYLDLSGVKLLPGNSGELKLNSCVVDKSQVAKLEYKGAASFTKLLVKNSGSTRVMPYRPRKSKQPSIYSFLSPQKQVVPESPIVANSPVVSGLSPVSVVESPSM